MRRVLRLLLACSALSLAASPGHADAPAVPGYRIVGKIAGPDGNWDYASFDPVHRRLYVGRDYGVMAVDVDSGKVTPTLVAGSHVHSALALPGGDRLLVTNGGTGQIFIADAQSGAILSTIAADKDPDDAAYDPASGLAFVMNHASGDITVVDPVKGAAVGTIAIGGELEGAATDGQGHLFVNVPDQKTVAVIDTRKRSVVAHYALSACDDPAGLGYAAKSGVLVAACDNAVAKVLSASDGRDLATIPIGKGADSVIVNDATAQALVPTGYDGMLTAIDVHDADHVASLGQVPTSHGAHTGAVDVSTGKLFLPTCDYGPAQPGSEHRPHLPGTFGVLVGAAP